MKDLSSRSTTLTSENNLLQLNSHVNFKMRTGEDIVGILIDTHENSIEVANPVLVVIRPNEGLFVKSWNLLAEDEVIEVQFKDMYWCSKANQQAVGYYKKFLNEAQELLEEDDVDDEMYEDLLMSQVATKH
jgi:hypothetical protein